MKQAGANTISQAKETELAKRLVSDDADERFKCLKEISTLISQSKIKESQYRRIWKGLFYGLWAADKVPVQMDVAQKIAHMVHLFDKQSNEEMLNWIKAGFEIFHREWDKLDYWRTSKFLSLARFCVNEVYIFLENKNYNGKLVKEWNQVLLDNILGNKLQIKSTGLTLHVIQVFVEALLGLTEPPHVVLKTLLDPFIQFFSDSDDKALKQKVIEFVFRFFIKNLQEGQFSTFDAQKYAAYLLKKASSKEVSDVNRKFIYSVQKEFLKFVAPENPLMTKLDLDEEEELADEGIDASKLKKKEKPQAQAQVQGKGKGKKEKAVKQQENNNKAAAKKEEKSKLQAKTEKKEEEKKKANNKEVAAAKAQEKKGKKAKAIVEEVEDDEEGDWEDDEEDFDDAEGFDEDDEEIDDDFEDEEEEEEEEPPKKGKAAANKKGQKEPEKKGKQAAAQEKNNKNNKRGKAPIEEEEEDEEEVELPEDWEEQLLDEDLIDEMIEEEGDDELAMLNNAIMQGNGTVAGYPPYMFQTPKQQRKFFEKLNTDYYVKLEAAQKRKLEHSRKVNFQLTKNTVKEFDKRNKVNSDGNDIGTESPGKGILKKSTVITSKVTIASKKPGKQVQVKTQQPQQNKKQQQQQPKNGGGKNKQNNQKNAGKKKMKV